MKTNHDYKLIAEQAVNDAIAQIQTKLGQNDGGYAGLWFSDKDEALQAFTKLLADYAEAEDMAMKFYAEQK